MSDPWQIIAQAGESEQLVLYCDYLAKVLNDIVRKYITIPDGARMLQPPRELQLEYLALIPAWTPFNFALRDVLAVATSDDGYEDTILVIWDHRGGWVGWEIVDCLRRGMTIDVSYEIALKTLGSGSRLVDTRVAVRLEGDRVIVQSGDSALDGEVAKCLNSAGPWRDAAGERHPTRDGERMTVACQHLTGYAVELVALTSDLREPV